MSGRKSLAFGIWLVFCFLVSVSYVAAQTAPQDHAQIYKRAVTAVDNAEKKLAGNHTSEAKALIKEANSLFGILQKEMPEKMKTMELTPQQEEQWNRNNKLGEDSSANGQALEKSGLEKQKKSDALEAQGHAGYGGEIAARGGTGTKSGPESSFKGGHLSFEKSPTGLWLSHEITSGRAKSNKHGFLIFFISNQSSP